MEGNKAFDYDEKHEINYPKVEIKNPSKSWWSGDERVEPFMGNITKALDRSGLKGQKRTDVYNRAYEAVYNAIKFYCDN